MFLNLKFLVTSHCVLSRQCLSRLIVRKSLRSQILHFRFTWLGIRGLIRGCILICGGILVRGCILLIRGCIRRARLITFAIIIKIRTRNILLQSTNYPAVTSFCSTLFRRTEKNCHRPIAFEVRGISSGPDPPIIAFEIFSADLIHHISSDRRRCSWGFREIDKN